MQIVRRKIVKGLKISSKVLLLEEAERRWIEALLMKPSSFGGVGGVGGCWVSFLRSGGVNNVSNFSHSACWIDSGSGGVEAQFCGQKLNHVRMRGIVNPSCQELQTGSGLS